MFKLIDFSLGSRKTEDGRQTPGAAARAVRARMAASSLWDTVDSQILVGSRYITTRITYPQQNEYFDGTAISRSCRSAFELLQAR